MSFVNPNRKANAKNGKLLCSSELQLTPISTVYFHKQLIYNFPESVDAIITYYNFHFLANEHEIN